MFITEPSIRCETYSAAVKLLLAEGFVKIKRDEYVNRKRNAKIERHVRTGFAIRIRTSVG